uniref:Sulfotransferase n=2 Tax=Chenopodium quinoa TaxID=63459 RepID=A0A803MMS9_CHEQI
MIMKYFEDFCKGDFPFGSYEDHILGYWNEHTRNSNKVLFLEYEGLKTDPYDQVKRLAEFMGCPFSKVEEKGNIVEEIVKLCSLDSLKEKEVNKSGKFYDFVENNALFRKGEVGDWINYLNPSIVKELLHDLQEKLKKSGFSFKYYQQNF